MQFLSNLSQNSIVMVDAYSKVPLFFNIRSYPIGKQKLLFNYKSSNMDLSMFLKC